VSASSPSRPYRHAPRRSISANTRSASWSFTPSTVCRPSAMEWRALCYQAKVPLVPAHVEQPILRAAISLTHHQQSRQGLWMAARNSAEVMIVYWLTHAHF
jgi:hypothetical protein